LLDPRHPQFATYAGDEDQHQDMKVLSDAIPAHTTQDTPKKHNRLVGKKWIPDPLSGAGAGGERKETFWAMQSLRGRKEHETKTRREPDWSIPEC
jgi:hypothetical protein